MNEQTRVKKDTRSLFEMTTDVLPTFKLPFLQRKTLVAITALAVLITGLVVGIFLVLGPRAFFDIRRQAAVSGGVEYQLTASKTQVVSGETVDFTVSILPKTYQVTALDLTLEYDTAVWDYIGLSPKNSFKYPLTATPIYAPQTGYPEVILYPNIGGDPYYTTPAVRQNPPQTPVFDGVKSRVRLALGATCDRCYLSTGPSPTPLPGVPPIPPCLSNPTPACYPLPTGSIFTQVATLTLRAKSGVTSPNAAVSLTSATQTTALNSDVDVTNTTLPSPVIVSVQVPTPSPTPTQTPGSSRTLTLQVSAPEDDANSCNWPVTGNSSVRVGSTSCSYTGGFRFLNTGLPQGATIQSAYLELNSLYKSPGGLTLILNADSASYSPSRNSASFVDRDTSTSARPRTTASVSWTPTAFTSGSWQRSPDIRSVVQEMVNHSAWQSANSLTLMVNPTTVDGSYWNVGTADDGASDAARLVVTYAPASASTPTPVLPTPTPIPTSTPRPTSIPTSAPSPTLSPTTPPQLTPTPTPPPVSSCQYDVSNTIPGRIQAENFTCGGQGVAYYDTDSSNNGNSYRVSEAVDIQPTGDVGGGHNVGWIRNGEWLDYRVQVSQTGTYSVTFRTASNTFSGSRLFRLLVNGQDVTGQLTAPKTGGWQSYVNVTASNIHLTSGSHRLRLQIDGGGFNLNYMDFQLTSAPVSRTLTLQVSAPEDDANSCNWPVTGNSSVRVGSTSCSYTGGFRFLNTGLPQGATIQSAYLELNSLYKSPGGLTLILNADSASYSPSRNSASFVDRDTSTSARPRTTASVSWTPTAFTSGSWQRSPDIRSVVQEMVNHSAWQSANSLTLMVNPTTVDGSYWNVGTADDGASDAARLVVTYTTN